MRRRRPASRSRSPRRCAQPRASTPAAVPRSRAAVRLRQHRSREPASTSATSTAPAPFATSGDHERRRPVLRLRQRRLGGSVSRGRRIARRSGRRPPARGIALYRNRGNGTFEDVTARSGIAHGQYGMGACAADYDNDGFIDLYVTNVGPNTLYHNNGGKSFSDVTRAAGVGSSSFGASCAFADVDRDGYVDLFVINYVDARLDNNVFCGDAAAKLRVYCHPLNFAPLASVLYHNNGNGTFTDISQKAGIGPHRGNGLGVVVGDYDDDGWPDIFVANDTTPNFLYHNEGGGVFKEIALASGVSVAADGRARAGMGTDFGDYDNDGRLDLFVTNHELETHTLFRNLGRGSVRRDDDRERCRRRDAAVRRLRHAVLRLRQRRRPRPRRRQRPRHERFRALQARLEGSAAQAAVPKRGRRPVQGGGPNVGIGLRGRSRRPHARRRRHRQRRRPRPARDEQRRAGRAAAQRRRDPATTPCCCALRRHEEQPRRHRRPRAPDGRRRRRRSGKSRPDRAISARAICACISVSAGPADIAASRSAGRRAQPRRFRTWPANAIVTVTEGRGVTARTSVSEVVQAFGLPGRPAGLKACTTSVGRPVPRGRRRSDPRRGPSAFPTRPLGQRISTRVDAIGGAQSEVRAASRCARDSCRRSAPPRPACARRPSPGPWRRSRRDCSSSVRPYDAHEHVIQWSPPVVSLRSSVGRSFRLTTRTSMSPSLS